MRRGDLVTVAINGDYGKPRPALIVQSDTFSAVPSVVVLLLTSGAGAEPSMRVAVRPSAETGLRLASYIMVDKVVTVPRERAGTVMGRIDDATMRRVSQALAGFLALEDVVSGG